ncbi:MAG: hypothetical protein KDA24_08150 [Deltaproteobacteria bacterium]|nr:hypothetical protein [Deltaproteobacteria bacterium]
MVGIVLLALFVWIPRPSAAQPEIEELLREVEALMGRGSADVDPLALVRQELPAVEGAAAMPRRGPIEAEVITRAEAVAHVQGLIDEQLPPERARAMEIGWKALGLLRPEQELRAEVLRLYGAQVGGFFDPQTRTLYLLDDVHPLMQQPVIRHELTHALQDQHWTLATWLEGAHEDEDRAAAMQAVLEGHASHVMNRVTLGGLGVTPESLASGADQGMMAELAELLGLDQANVSAADLAQGLDLGLDDDLATMLLPRDTPPALRAQLLFPYVVGTRFVSGYLEAHPEDPMGAFLFARPPKSSAEVLAPHLWESGTFLPGLTKPGTFLPGWKQLWDSALGRLLTHVVLTDQGDPFAGSPEGARWVRPSRDRNVALTAEWHGDRVVVYEPNKSKPGTAVPGQPVVLWVSDWGSERAALAVAEAAKSRLPKAKIERQGGRVVVLSGAPAHLRRAAVSAAFLWN